MIKFNRCTVLTITALLLLPFSTFAESWSCRHDNDVREVHIVQASSEPVPCSVVYKKLTEGVEDQVLWTAANDANFCHEKAQAFVDKQISWGWTCVETIADENDTDTTVETEVAPAESIPTESMPVEEASSALESSENKDLAK